jgi:hypothetical protein
MLDLTAYGGDPVLTGTYSGGDITIPIDANSYLFRK